MKSIPQSTGVSVKDMSEEVVPLLRELQPLLAPSQQTAPVEAKTNDSTIERRISVLESGIFGSTKSGGFLARLLGLEKAWSGAVQDGTAIARLEQLEKTLL